MRAVKAVAFFPDCLRHVKGEWAGQPFVLEPWAERIRHVATGAHSTFVVANNHFRDKAATNALQLLHLLKRTRVKVPPPLLQLYPEELDPIASHEGTTPSLFLSS